MTDWNDGTNHGWNSGDCPVHPETVVEYWLRGGGGDECKAECPRWKHKDDAYDIIAFRVVKPYVEPKVIWVNEYPTGVAIYTSEENARKFSGPSVHRIAVKYVECKE
jgi:hypothetical protein